MGFRGQSTSKNWNFSMKIGRIGDYVMPEGMLLFFFVSATRGRVYLVTQTLNWPFWPFKGVKLQK